VKAIDNLEAIQSCIQVATTGRVSAIAPIIVFLSQSHVINSPHGGGRRHLRRRLCQSSSPGSSVRACKSSQDRIVVWLNKDPIGEDGGNNVFRYVNNNAINKYDSFGHSPTSCCDAATVAEGYKVLKDRWLKAVKYLDSHGAVLDPNDINGISCLESANHILAFMSPTPRCWVCYIQTRRDPKQNGWNENSIRCDSVSNKGANYHIVFDWWHQKDTGTAYAPYQESIYDQEFAICDPTDNGALYSSGNVAPHDNCDANSNVPHERTSWLDSLLPPYATR
jgi:hypothetical protein